MNVQVSRSGLIRAIETKRNEVSKEHELKVAAYKIAFAKHKAAVIEEVKKLHASMKLARTIEELTSELKYNSQVRMPNAPDKTGEAHTAPYDRALKLLNLSNDTAFLLNEKKDEWLIKLL